MLIVLRPNLFNTRSFLLRTVGAFTQIQTLVHQPFKLQSFKWQTKTKLFRWILSSSGSFGITFLEFHLKFSFAPSCSWLRSSRRNSDSRRGSISVLFPWARRNLRPSWVHCNRIPKDSLQGLTVETPWVAGCFQELASAPNRRLEKLV
jgi:hypothetical protein